MTTLVIPSGLLKSSDHGPLLTEQEFNELPSHTLVLVSWHGEGSTTAVYEIRIGKWNDRQVWMPSVVPGACRVDTVGCRAGTHNRAMWVSLWPKK